MPVNPIPDGFHTVTPYLVVKGATGLIDFLRKAFDAETLFMSKRPDGTVGHAQVKIGDSMVMLAEATPEYPASPCAIYMYVKDADALYKRAIQAGATSVMEPADMFYGDRNAGVKDATGMQWWIGTHIKEVSQEEVERISAEMAKKRG
jgi:PhnB protein